MAFADLLNEYVDSFMFLFWKHNQSASLTLPPGPEHLLLYLSVLFLLLLFCSKLQLVLLKWKKVKKEKNVKLVDF